MMEKINIKKLLLCIGIIIFIGFLAGYLNKDELDIYNELKKPIGAPPMIMFPIMWNLIYTGLGIALYYIWESEDTIKEDLLWLFLIQFIVNISWMFVFFSLKLYFLAFLILIVLWLFVFVFIASLLQLKRKIAYMQIPYLIWLSFALYLNGMIWILNI